MQLKFGETLCSVGQQVLFLISVSHLKNIINLIPVLNDKW